MQQIFADFPEFTPLHLTHKEEYERLIAEHPPYSDILFPTLHIWWNLGGQLSISLIKNNLVINYHIPFDPANSGYGLIGRHHIDESTINILDHLKSKGSEARLVHVPEFVIDAMHQRDTFKLIEERDYGEYVLGTEALSNLSGKTYASLRYRINNFKRGVEDKNLVEKSLDLSHHSVQEEIYDRVLEWEKLYPTHNDPNRSEHLAMKQSLTNAAYLGLENLAIFINGELCGIAIYSRSPGKSDYILHHIKANYGVRYITDYMHHRLASIARDNGIDFINIEMDLGIENLRNHKITLKPIKFLKKYTVQL